MKKIICIAIVMAMLFSLTAFAAKENYDFLAADYDSYEAEQTVTLKLNKPLKILDSLAESGELAGLDTFVDIRAYIESLFSAKSDLKMAYKISDNKKSLKMALTGKTGATLVSNENYIEDIRANTGMWMELGVEDPENPVYNLILLPASNKYITMTADDLLPDGESKAEFGESMTAVLQLMTEPAAKSEMIELIKNNSEINKIRGGYNLKMDLNGLINYITEYSALTGMTMPEIDPETLPVTFEMSGDYILNVSGQIKSTASEIRIAVNLFELIASLVGDDMVPEWITLENSDIDISILSDAEYKNINKVGKVDFPVLTEENSVSISDIFPGSGYFGYYYWSGSTGDVIYENGNYYLAIETVVEQNAYGETNLFSYENGKTVFDSKSYHGIMSFDPAKKVVSEEGLGDRTADFFIRDGKTYLNINDFYVFDMETNSFVYSLDKKEFEYSFSAIEDDWSYEDDDEDDYGDVPEYVRYWNCATDSVINENGEYCFPLRDMLCHAFPEGTYYLNYDSGYIYFSGDYYGEVSINANNGTAIANGEECAANVFLKNGRTYIGASAVEKLFGMKANDITYSFDDNAFYFWFTNIKEAENEENFDYPFDIYASVDDAYEEGDEKVYLPLRALIENNYDSRYSIDYADGKVILSNSATGDETVIDVADKSYVQNGGNRTFADVVKKNGSTYIESKTVCDIFGLETEFIDHDLLNGGYDCYFSAIIEEE